MSQSRLTSMISTTTTTIIFFILVIFGCLARSSSSSSSSQPPQGLSQWSGAIAKRHFCMSRRYHSVSFDGTSVRFVVPKKVRTSGATSLQNAFQVFHLTFHKQNQTFAYKSQLLFDSTAYPIGGLYLSSMNIFIEFYKSVTPVRSAANKTVTPKFAYCPFYDPPEFRRNDCLRSCRTKPDADTAFTRLNICDWRYLDKPCMVQHRHNVMTKLYPSEMSTMLQASASRAFLFESGRKRIVYMLTNATHSVVLRSGDIEDTNNFQWSREVLGEKINFVGAFNWETEYNAHKMFVVVRDGKQDLQVRELLQVSPFQLGGKNIPYRAFFGCESKPGTNEFWNDNKLGGTSKLAKIFWVVVVLAVIGSLLVLASVAYFHRRALRLDQMMTTTTITTTNDNNNRT